jgi:hypothetical protein
LGIDRVYIDNVRLLGVGLPLQTESAGVTTSNAPIQIAQTGITSLIETARLQWQGLVQVPEGSVGVALGQVGITASNLPLDKVSGTKLNEAENVWDASISKRSLNDQLFLTNANTVFALASLDQQPASDEIGLNDNAPFTSDSHTVNSQPNASLSEVESTSVLASVVNENRTYEATVNEHWSTIGDRPIGIADFNVSADLSAPGGEGTIAERNVFNAKKLSLVLLQPLPGLIGQRNGIVESPSFFNAATSLKQSENQNNQRALQHNLSFGSLTLPPDRDVVNQSASFGTGLVGLTADQLALLNRATITIADLADGYLALTLGTTITLDTDAAGYGWFIDQTPFLNEEFVSGASSLVKREASDSNDEIRATNDASSWQFFAKPDSTADGQMDLPTVLRHEHGH